MMGTEDTLIEKLLEDDEDFKDLYSEHRQLDDKVAILEDKEVLTIDDELEIKQLKKLKLSLKDKMQNKIKKLKK